MDIIKVIAIGILGTILTMFLRTSKSDFAPLAVLATGIIIIIIIVNALGEVILAFNDIVDKSGIDKKLFQGILKIVGIGYIVEYSSSICADFDVASIGKKIELAGKITIFLMAMPVVTTLIESVERLLSI